MSDKDNKKELLEEAAGMAASSVSASRETIHNEVKMKPSLIITLYDPFVWDGEDVTTVDLSGLYDMTAEDMFVIDDQMRKRGFSGMNPEITRQYALLAAARINKKPWEWLNKIKARDAVRIKNVIAGFFYT